MAKRNAYIAAGFFGVATLSTFVAVGYVERGIVERSVGRAALGKPISERQMIERRRGRMAEVAIAGTTAQ